MLADEEDLVLNDSEDGEPAGPEAAAEVGERGNRTVPAHIRKLARDTAGQHDMTVADFLTEAIVAYASWLKETEAVLDEVLEDPMREIRIRDARIDALERRISVLEEQAQRDLAGNRVWLENYVRRPWLRRRGY